jgi:hypothetical protein
MSVEKIKIGGIEFNGRELFGIIKVRRNPKTVSIWWDIGSLDIDPMASDAIAHHWQDSSYDLQIADIAGRHPLPDMHIMTGGRWAHATRIHPAIADEVIALIKQAWTEALAPIPKTSRARHELTLRQIKDGSYFSGELCSNNQSKNP